MGSLVLNETSIRQRPGQRSVSLVFEIAENCLNHSELSQRCKHRFARSGRSNYSYRMTEEFVLSRVSGQESCEGRRTYD